MDAKKLLQNIAKARDAVFKARENRKCKCSDFCLQYEGSCQCGSHRPVIRAENELQLLLNSIEKEEEEEEEEEGAVDSAWHDLDLSAWVLKYTGKEEAKEPQLVEAKALSTEYGLQVVYEHVIGDRKGERFTVFYPSGVKEDKLLSCPAGPLAGF